MIPLEVRVKNFLDSVSFFADKKQQHAMWVDGDPGDSFLMSLNEVYCQFFDDNDIDNFIADELDTAPLTSEQRHGIRLFRDALNKFSVVREKFSQPIRDADLITDPEWNELVVLAQSTLRKWQK